jgi:hypothetical protein
MGHSTITDFKMKGHRQADEARAPSVHDRGGEPKDARQLLEEAEQLFRAGRMTESAVAFEALLPFHDYASDGYYGLGVIRLHQGNHRDAYALLQAALKLHPSANTYYWLGEIERIEGETSASIDFYERALQMDADHVGARERLARSLPLDAKPQEASRRMERQDVKPADARPATAHAPQHGMMKVMSADPSVFAQETLELLRAVDRSVRPRLSAHAGRLMARLSLLVALLLVLVRYPHPALKVTLMMGAIGVLAIASLLAIVLRVLTTTVTFGEARLLITTGVLGRRYRNLELYRVENVYLVRSLINRLTGDGVIEFHIEEGRSGKPEVLRVFGIAPIAELLKLHDDLRQLVFNLRTGQWGKGIIS